MELEPVMISALAHWSYCPRRCGLIHVEHVWEENAFTIQGTEAHERADTAITRTERGVRVERALPLWSDRYGLVGRADIVEFVTKTTGESPRPVEYKLGKPTRTAHAELQLCAQALCLEEMFGVSVEEGFVYWAATKERRLVAIDAPLREAVQVAIREVRDMLQTGLLQPPVADKRCPKCSLLDACLPFSVQAAGRSRPNSLYAPMPEAD